MTSSIRPDPPSTSTTSPQTAATITSTHQMFMAMFILLFFGVILIEVAGISPNVGDGVIVVLLIMLVVQGITRANPFISWVNSHPLTPTQ